MNIMVVEDDIVTQMAIQLRSITLGELVFWVPTHQHC